LNVNQLPLNGTLTRFTFTAKLLLFVGFLSL